MRGLLFVTILIVFMAAVFCAWVYFQMKYNKGEAEASPAGPPEWQVELKEAESHPITTIFLIRGNKREYWTSVNRLDTDYDDQLFRAQASAEDEVIDRNATQKVLNDR